MNMKHNFIIGDLNSGTFVVFVLSEILTVLVRGSSLDRDRSPTMSSSVHSQLRSSAVSDLSDSAQHVQIRRS